MAKDIIDDLMAQILAAAPGFTPDHAHEVALRIRQDWGGSQVYIRKAPAEGKAFRLGTALAAGVPIAQAVSDLGVCRRTGYYLLRRRLSRW